MNFRHLLSLPLSLALGGVVLGEEEKTALRQAPETSVAAKRYLVRQTGLRTTAPLEVESPNQHSVELKNGVTLHVDFP